jgi:hypothetical protein
MAVSTSFAQHLAPGIREIVGTNLAGRVSYYSQLLDVETTTRNYEDYLAAAGLPIASDKPELSPIQSYDPLEGGTKRVTPSVTAIGFEVSEEAWEDDLYQGRGSALRDAANSLADSLAEVVEVQAHRIFNSEAFLTTAVPDFLRVLPDNLSTISLFNTGHNPVTGGEVSAQSNRPSTDVDLTLTSYRAGLIQFRKWRTDRNLRIPMYTRPRALVVSPDLEYDAMEIVRNAMRPDTINQVNNVSQNATSIIVSDYIDDADQWILLGQKHYLKFLWRWRPRMDSFDDRRARAAIQVAYQRFTRAAIHWLGTYGSPGA